MTISEDTANQPASVTWTTAQWNSGNGKTTGAFTPQSSTLLLALLAADGVTSGAVTGAVTDSLGSGSWTLLKRSNAIVAAALGGTCEVWCRDIVTGGTSMTVTATGSANAQPGGVLAVRCLLGAAVTVSQTGAATAFNSNSSAMQASLAATQSGLSVVYGAGLNYDNATSPTLLANSSNVTANLDSSNGDTWTTFRSTGVTGSGSTAYGYSAPAAVHVNVAIVEILAAAAAAAVSPVLVTPGAVGRSYSW